MRAYLVGSGIASLAAAAYLIRDGGVLPGNVTIFETDERVGGAMGLFGSPERGYSLPTGRIFEERFSCARDLFLLVPNSAGIERGSRPEGARLALPEAIWLVSRPQTLAPASQGLPAL